VLKNYLDYKIHRDSSLLSTEEVAKLMEVATETETGPEYASVEQEIKAAVASKIRLKVKEYLKERIETPHWVALRQYMAGERMGAGTEEGLAVVMSQMVMQA
jgi:hypothetical protein